ncbi:MAG TPA: PDR/VanB family oxidoreductase [Burkholderiaceae bacterium]|jgi:vanillate O-demethylase ferredoxin subunit
MDVALDAAPAVALATDARPLPLRLTAIRYAARGVNVYELQAIDGMPLPTFTPGAHVDLHLRPGIVRQYSLIGPTGDAGHYAVAVKRDPAGRGGSVHLHDVVRVGDMIDVGRPRNHFVLHENARHSVLLAGGIGVTPMVAMARRLRELGSAFTLHYSVRRRDEAAFLDLLKGEELRLHVDVEREGRFMDVGSIVAEAPADAHLYCCGPAPMLDAFEAAAQGRPGGLVHLERFTAAAPSATAGGYRVRLERSGRVVPVRPGQTILEALRATGIDVQASCEQGICGTCETRVLRGRPDHRDSLLSDEERAANRAMMICCSGSLDDELVLDL